MSKQKKIPFEILQLTYIRLDSLLITWALAVFFLVLYFKMNIASLNIDFESY